MTSLARYRGVQREIAHNTKHLNKPLRIPVLAVGVRLCSGRRSLATSATPPPTSAAK